MTTANTVRLDLTAELPVASWAPLVARVEELVASTSIARGHDEHSRAPSRKVLESAAVAPSLSSLASLCPSLQELCDRLELERADAELLALAVAPCLSGRVARGYALLRHDPDGVHLTGALAVELLGVEGRAGASVVFSRLAAGAPLVDLELIRLPSRQTFESAAPIRVGHRVVSWMLGRTALPRDGEIEWSCAANQTPDQLVLSPAGQSSFAAVQSRLQCHSPSGPPLLPIVVLTGPEGCGRELAAAHLAGSLGQPTLRVDLDDSGGVEQLRAAIVEARLQRAWLHVRGIERVSADAQAAIRGLLSQWAPGVSLGVRNLDCAQPFLPSARSHEVVPLERPGPEERLALWRQYLPDRMCADSRVVERLAQTYRLTGKQLRAAVKKATGSADEIAALRAPSESTLVQAVRDTIPCALSRVARLIAPAESWSDLVVDEETQALLSLVLANFRHRAQVLDRWGFARRFGRGLGMSALFSGPPGTGKTMAAGLIAAELGLPLYQVELSQIVSKWIGETEKHIDELFEEAEAMSAMILFDEADSLFARRTDVSSANDRYANLEVNHLLQRLEAFTGVVILTTNNAGAIDPAFNRRFAYCISFPLPDAAQRADLWRRALPTEAPVAPDVDFEDLGRELELSGGHIKNAVLRAAFLAAEAGRPIGHEILELTGKLELRQLGMAVRNFDLSTAWAELGRATPTSS